VSIYWLSIKVAVFTAKSCTFAVIYLLGTYFALVKRDPSEARHDRYTALSNRNSFGIPCCSFCGTGSFKVWSKIST
jgi:hypothetical protein